MPRNIKLTIEYDGGNYLGWQRQKNPRTVQGTLESAIIRLTDRPASLTGSGRTDAGVHALGQVANFHTNTHLHVKDVQNALNAILPRDIRVIGCEEMPESFHARYDVVRKTYRYHIVNRPLPPAIGRQYAWHIKHPLDLDAIKQALVYFVGTHDFKSFEGAGSPRSSSVREIIKANLTCEDKGKPALTFEANGFLRHMVRNMVGTLVDVGTAKTAPHDIKTILDAKDRSHAGITAPAHGLFLVRVDYAALPNGSM